MSKIILLVGPSGSGKTVIAENLLQSENFQKLRTATTRAKRDTESETAYYFLSKNEFLTMEGNNGFVETNIYAGKYYGTPRTEVAKALDNNTNIVIPIDINGARKFKELYRDNALMFFVYRDKQKVIEGIVERNIPIEEKSKRIIQLDTEYLLMNECDFIINNNHTIEHSAVQIKNLI